MRQLDAIATRRPIDSAQRILDPFYAHSPNTLFNRINLNSSRRVFIAHSWSDTCFSFVPRIFMHETTSRRAVEWEMSAKNKEYVIKDVWIASGNEFKLYVLCVRRVSHIKRPTRMHYKVLSSTFQCTLSIYTCDDVYWQWNEVNTLLHTAGMARRIKYIHSCTYMHEERESKSEQGI